MEIKKGDLVLYRFSEECTGIALEIGDTMIKVRWNDEDIVEWMPYYAPEKLNV